MTLLIEEFTAVMNSDLRNEWTHLNFYLYHASAQPVLGFAFFIYQRSRSWLTKSF